MILCSLLTRNPLRINPFVFYVLLLFFFFSYTETLLRDRSYSELYDCGFRDIILRLLSRTETLSAILTLRRFSCDFVGFTILDDGPRVADHQRSRVLHGPRRFSVYTQVGTRSLDQKKNLTIN